MSYAVVLLAAVVLLGGVLLGLARERIVLLHLLLAGLLLGPRIPLGRISQMQRLDLRVDDVIIAILCVVALLRALYRPRERAVTPAIIWLALFGVSSLVSSFLGASANDELSMTTSLVFWAKEVAYMSLAFSVPFLLRSPRDLAGLARAAALLYSLNLGWLAWQLASASKGTLFELIHVPSYGYTLIAESQPFSVASVWYFGFLLWTTLFFFGRRRWTCLVLAAGCLAGVLSTLSRTFYAGVALAILLVVGAVFLARVPQRGNRLRLALFCVALCGLGAAVMIRLEASGLPVFRLRADAVRTAIVESRAEHIWAPLLDRLGERWLLGFGRGSLLSVLRVSDEAHNYALRILIETGVVGLVLLGFAFVAVLVSAWRQARSDRAPIERTVGILLLLALPSLGLVCMTQDGLYVSKVAVPLYLLIGVQGYLRGLARRGELPAAEPARPGHGA